MSGLCRACSSVIALGFVDFRVSSFGVLCLRSRAGDSFAAFGERNARIVFSGTFAACVRDEEMFWIRD